MQAQEENTHKHTHWGRPTSVVFALRFYRPVVVPVSSSSRRCFSDHTSVPHDDSSNRSGKCDSGMRREADRLRRYLSDSVQTSTSLTAGEQLN